MLKRKIHIAGTGCALADFFYNQVDFTADIFRKFASKTIGDGGLSPGKLVFTNELENFTKKSYPEILHELVGKSEYSSVNLGGPSLVALIHAAQMLPQPQFEVSFYGCTGTDETAKLIRQKVAKTPLNTDNYVTIPDENTAFTHVLTDPAFDNGQGERTFINNIGASWKYNPEFLSNSFFDADIVCFGGTALVPQIHDKLDLLLQKVKSRGGINVVNTVFDFRNEKQNPGKKWPLGQTEECYKNIDLLVMNCEESLKISGRSTMKEAANFFTTKGVASFIITHGNKDLLAHSNGSIFKHLPLQYFPVSDQIGIDLLAKPESIGDTTGCGDNFVGGLIASLAQQLIHLKKGDFDMIEAISWGVASGGMTCFCIGGTWFEEEQGEKLAIVKSYQQLYLKQIGR
jgi:sugar/nucleoside kinase (ribokinase family)